MNKGKTQRETTLEHMYIEEGAGISVLIHDWTRFELFFEYLRFSHSPEQAHGFA